MLQLNSYENRVFQVVSRRRPGRRRQVLSPRSLERRADPRGARASPPSSPQREIPVAASLQLARDADSPHAAAITLAGATLGVAAIGSHALSLRRLRTPRRPRARARRPRGPALARPLHRPAACASARQAPLQPPDHARRRRRYGVASRDFLLGLDILPPDSRRRLARARRAARSRPAAAPSMRRRRAALRLHGDCHLGNVLWTERRPALRRPRRRRQRPGDAGPVDAALGRPRGDVAASCSTCSRATSRSWTSTGASSA